MLIWHELLRFSFSHKHTIDVWQDKSFCGSVQKLLCSCALTLLPWMVLPMNDSLWCHTIRRSWKHMQHRSKLAFRGVVHLENTLFWFSTTIHRILQKLSLWQTLTAQTNVGNEIYGHSRLWMEYIKYKSYHQRSLKGKLVLEISTERFIRIVKTEWDEMSSKYTSWMSSKFSNFDQKFLFRYTYSFWKSTITHAKDWHHGHSQPPPSMFYLNIFVSCAQKQMLL